MLLGGLIPLGSGVILIILQLSAVIDSYIFVDFAAQDGKIGQIEILESLVASDVILAAHQSVLSSYRPSALIVTLYLIVSHVQWGRIHVLELQIMLLDGQSRRCCRLEGP